MVELFQTIPISFVLAMGVLGLIVGSFLNVVIHRLPIMMEKEWRSECELLLNNAEDSAAVAPPYNLVQPRSRCPQCERPISALENIPVLSYIVLGGRCRGCKSKISPRYPLIEILCGITGATVAAHFGFGIAALAAFGLTCCLIALAAIDFDTQLLPDAITQPLLWAGLVLNFFGVFVTLEEALLGAVFGYLALWLVFWGFKLATGKDGMGYGDFKLLAVIGAWLGWQILPLVIVLSSIVGACIGVSMMVFFSQDRSKPIPFGPYLAIAGWIALLWGDAIMRQYLYGSGAL